MAGDRVSGTKIWTYRQKHGGHKLGQGIGSDKQGHRHEDSDRDTVMDKQGQGERD